MTKPFSLDTIVSLCKRRGFVFPSAEIYGGLNGVYDIGPLGALLKDNIRNAWKKSLLMLDVDVFFIEGSLLGPHAMWLASGHVEHFSDPMVDCLQCKHRYRADEIDITKACPHCGNKKWTDVRQFNMMFQTQLGASADAASVAYLRPETAQAIYVDFKNVMTSCRAKVPFAIAQLGKAFRNEITPKQFLFRVREFEQMELEWFCKPESAGEFFIFWRDHQIAFVQSVGLRKDHIRIHEQSAEERAHYSLATTDIEYHFPFGWKELEGIANRGNFDLTQHSKFSGKDLSVFDEQSKQSYVPYIVESSIGIDRLMLAVLCDAYHEETVDNEQRIVLRFAPHIAPVRAAFLPLTKEQIEPMEKIFKKYKHSGFNVQFDESGSIGRRYRRQDEIGTPYCFTYDYDSAKDGCVTIRHRDSMKQERVSIDAIQEYLL